MTTEGAMRDLSLTPIRVVTLTQRDLEDVIARAVTSALQGFRSERATPALILSPRQIARMAKIRDERVYDAITSGRLKASQDAAGRYRISAADANEWIASLAKYRA